MCVFPHAGERKYASRTPCKNFSESEKEPWQYALNAYRTTKMKGIVLHPLHEDFLWWTSLANYLCIRRRWGVDESAAHRLYEMFEYFSFIQEKKGMEDGDVQERMDEFLPWHYYHERASVE